MIAAIGGANEPGEAKCPCGFRGSCMVRVYPETCGRGTAAQGNRLFLHALVAHEPVRRERRADRGDRATFLRPDACPVVAGYCGTSGDGQGTVGDDKDVSDVVQWIVVVATIRGVGVTLSLRRQSDIGSNRNVGVNDWRIGGLLPQVPQES